MCPTPTLHYRQYSTVAHDSILCSTQVDTELRSSGALLRLPDPFLFIYLHPSIHMHTPVLIYTCAPSRALSLSDAQINLSHKLRGWLPRDRPAGGIDLPAARGPSAGLGCWEAGGVGGRVDLTRRPRISVSRARTVDGVRSRGIAAAAAPGLLGIKISLHFHQQGG